MGCFIFHPSSANNAPKYWAPGSSCRVDMTVFITKKTLFNSEVPTSKFEVSTAQPLPKLVTGSGVTGYT